MIKRATESEGSNFCDEDRFVKSPFQVKSLVLSSNSRGVELVQLSIIPIYLQKWAISSILSTMKVKRNS